MEFSIRLDEGNNLIERHPMNGNIAVTVPGESFEEENWII